MEWSAMEGCLRKLGLTGGFLLPLFFSFFFFASAVLADSDAVLIGGSNVSGYSGEATEITDLQVSATGSPTVPVKLLVSNGTLQMTTTTGLTFTGGSSGSTLQFSGSLSDVNTALATLQYTRVGTGSDTLEASLVEPGEVFFPDNDHLYEYVTYSSNWNNAKTNAESRSKYGATGYLATITSSAENEFVADRLESAGWMGASDSASEGDWKWVTGPEAGTSFWSGDGSGSAVGGRYENWNTGEPNDSSGEDCGQFLAGSTGLWNDLPCSTYSLPGYVVEYGSDDSPIDVSSKNLTITTNVNTAPDVPSSITPDSINDGSWTTDNTPTIGFTLSDDDSGDTLQYRVQIDDDSDFSSVVVDYASALAAQGARTFTVGQAVGGGSYAAGSAGQVLDDGSYYWRARTIDVAEDESSFVTANSGSIAFKVDATAPTAPGTPASAQAATDTTPTITWTASSDAGVGLNSSEPYTLEWSTSPDFSSKSSVAVTTNSYTVPSGSKLADGMWYFRVKSKDDLGTETSYSATLTKLIDTTAPSIPGNFALVSEASDSTPSWSWSASSDAGVGLASPAYRFEWSQSKDFTGNVFAVLTSNTSYTHTVALSDGAWYARVQAFDQLSQGSGFAIVGFTIDTSIPAAASPTPAGSSFVAVGSSSGAPTPSPTPQVTPTPTGSEIVLNKYQDYTDGNGKQIKLSPGQKVYFMHKEEEHSATVMEVGGNYVIVTVASTPTEIKLMLGEEKLHDVDGDGREDIGMKLNSILNGVAGINFWQIEDEKIVKTVANDKESVGLYEWWPLLAGLLGVLVLWLLLSARKRMDAPESR